jgi:threonine/homoserine/homoserine lactone efflux protein
MISIHDLLLFAAAAFVLVLTPGPNMIYLISRSVCQGRAAGIVSLLGVVAGFFVHVLAASFGLTALLLTIPFAYDVLKLAGAAYLLWMAWQAVDPRNAPMLAPKALAIDSPGKLLRMGFITSALNPKVAVFYLSLFPQFVDIHRGSVLAQSIALGLTQIAVSLSVNFCIVMSAAGIAAFFASRPAWLRAQRWMMGVTLSGLAVRIAFDKGRAA